MGIIIIRYLRTGNGGRHYVIRDTIITISLERARAMRMLSTLPVRIFGIRPISCLLELGSRVVALDFYSFLFWQIKS